MLKLNRFVVVGGFSFVLFAGLMAAFSPLAKAADIQGPSYPRYVLTLGLGEEQRPIERLSCKIEDTSIQEDRCIARVKCTGALTAQKSRIDLAFDLARVECSAANCDHAEACVLEKSERNSSVLGPKVIMNPSRTVSGQAF